MVSPRRFHSVDLASSKDRGIVPFTFFSLTLETHSVYSSDVFEIHRAMSLLNASRSFAFVWVLRRRSKGYDLSRHPGRVNPQQEQVFHRVNSIDNVNKGTTKEQGDFRLCFQEGRTAHATVHLISTSSHRANYFTHKPRSKLAEPGFSKRVQKCIKILQ